jgi:hypothetical protein
MSIYRYNFCFMQNRDLKKYLHSKLDFEKWEETIAEEAIITHYRNSSKISYGFPMSKNYFIIIKRFLKKVSNEFELQHLIFDRKNDKESLKNTEFIEPQSIFYLRNGEGKKEFYNYKLTSINTVNKLILERYKDVNDDTQFILEKLNKNLLFFQGNSFEIRTYVLIVQIDKKIYTFLYPLLIVNFGIEHINMAELLDFLDIGFDNNSNINSYNPFLEKIYQLVKKTATVIANICKISNYIYKLENRKKYKTNIKPTMQYHLYALDIILNEDKEPFLIDIILNPVYNVSKEETKTIREKNRIFDDLVDNFIIYFAKYNQINYDKSNFILFTDTTQIFEYKMIISKKVNDEFIENNDFLSKDGENFLIKCLNDDSIDFKVDNESFIHKVIEPSPEVEPECIFKDKKEEIVEKKIDNLLQKEKNEKLFGIASATIPIFLTTYLAKKTYETFIKKD